MPLSNASLRVLDASGKALASGLAVAANGSYGPVTLSGTGPFRIEACGFMLDEYRCVYAVTQLGGVVQLTPLTSAITVVASGLVPQTMMTGTVSGLDASKVDAAHVQVRNAIAPALVDAGLSSSADLFTTPVTPGSRTGYDRLLDNLAINIGQDTKAFAQIEPRLGSGFAYMESGSSTAGTMSMAASTASLSLNGIDTLYQQFASAMTDLSVCETQMPSLLSASAALSVEGAGNFAGTTDAVRAVQTGLCGLFGGYFGNVGAVWGYKAATPVLGRCDVSGAAPVCRARLVLQSSSGTLKPLGYVGDSMSVMLESGSWRLVGTGAGAVLPAQARIQRQRRSDGTNQVDRYSRAIAISIPVQSGLNCARITQTDLSGLDSTLAYYKPATSASTLSVWRASAGDARASTDPTSGSLNLSNDIWMPLPDGTDGDTVLRNFARSGKKLKATLYSDSACSTAFAPGGVTAAAINFELIGLPPMDARLAGLAWPELAAATRTSLSSLAGAASATLSLTANWTFLHDGLGMNTAAICTQASCSGSSKLAELTLSGTVKTAALKPAVGSTALLAKDFKQLRLSGHDGDGLLLTSDFQVCTQIAAGQPCQ